MCGRFSLRVEMDELLAYYGIIESDYPHTPRYNIAPGQMIPAVIHAGGQRRLGPLRWGLVPSWAKDDKVGYKMINARADTLLDKPAFRKPFASKRCIVPADGFYEWRKSDKQPFRITMTDNALFNLAALYDIWVTPSGEKLATCSIITTNPNELMAPIHERMPVILPKNRLEQWLSKTFTDTAQLLSYLEPYPAERMRAYPVSPIVGNVHNDVPACLDPIEWPAGAKESAEQLELF